MSSALDHKRFINRLEKTDFIARLEQWISQGVIPPFAFLFPETETGHFTDDDKPANDIVQLGFILRDKAGNVLVNRRATYGSAAKAGHTMTVGDSVLVGWSPVTLPDGRRFPASERDIRYIFHQEVPEISPIPPKCSFVGFVKNRKRTFMNGVEEILQYYFYLFDMQYDGTPDFSGTRFHKDKHDQAQGFFPIDEALAAAVEGNKADLRALEAVSGRHFSKIDYGDSILVRPSPGSLPPFVAHPPGVFLSHATPNHTFVDLIAQALKQAGVSVWSDHSTLWPGQSWPWEIADAIAYGPCFIVLCSAESRQSNGVQNEVLKAMERKRREAGYLIIPVVLEGKEKMEHVPEAIRDSLWVADLRDSADRQRQIDLLVDRVKEQVAQYGCLSVSR